MSNYKIIETATKKILKSSNYNFIFNKKNGAFVRWGSSYLEDPNYSEFGPELVDIEVSTICTKGCSFCYKDNKYSGKNMSLDTYAKILHKLPKTVTQVALGVGNLNANRELYQMMELSRLKGIIPNITVHPADVNVTTAQLLATYTGAVAVSMYNKFETYEAVQYLYKAGVEQVNIHFLLYEESKIDAISMLKDIAVNKHLKNKINAVIFLSLKKKGKALDKKNNLFTLASKETFKEVIEVAESLNIKYGFDSCSAFKYLDAIKNSKNFELKKQFAEPCESTLFSAYFNVDGEFFPCSFTEGTLGWKEGINITDSKIDFIKDIWNSDRVKLFRKKTLSCRECNINCQIYEI